MNTTLNEQLSQILLYIEADIGTTELTRLAVKTLLESVKALEVNTPEDFYEQFWTLITTIKTTTPRIGVMISYFSEIFDEIRENKAKIKTMEDIHSLLDAHITKIEEEIEENTQAIVTHGVEMITPGVNILVHSPSSTVKKVLARAREMGKDFRITLAHSSSTKTEGVIIFLQNLWIDFVVVPEFMLSNIEEEIDIMFVGGITLSSEHKFITSAWVDAAVSEIHYAKKKIVMFMSMKKFSLWKTEAKKDIVHKIKRVTCDDARIQPYNQMKFSHDRVDVDLFDAIVTEKGILTPEEIKKEYERMYEKNSRE